MAIKECVVCGGSFDAYGTEIMCGDLCRAVRTRNVRKAHKEKLRLTQPEKYKEQKRLERRRRKLRLAGVTEEFRRAEQERKERERLEVEAKKIKPCVVCGSNFVSKNNVKTCSEKCWLERYRETKCRPAKKLDPTARLSSKRDYYHRRHAEMVAAVNIINRIKTEGLSALL